METQDINVAARKYALKMLGLNNNQIVGDEIERKVGHIAQNFIAGAEWFEEKLALKKTK